MGSIRKYEYILTNLINLLKYKFTILAPNWGQNYYLIEVLLHMVRIIVGD